VIPPRILAPLVLASLVLPIAISVLVGVGHLLAAMGDQAGAAVLGYVALAGGILWTVMLVCLVVVLGIVALGRHEEPPEE
jgi:hypothetical protein